MKQHISNEQLVELSPEAKEKLRHWLTTRNVIQYDTESKTWGGGFNLTIGQMIEFLGNDYIDSLVDFCDGYWETLNARDSIKKPDELCDALWEACVSVLNKH